MSKDVYIGKVTIVFQKSATWKKGLAKFCKALMKMERYTIKALQTLVWHLSMGANERSEFLWKKKIMYDQVRANNAKD